MKKRLIILIVVMAVLLTSLGVFAIVRAVSSNRAPALETVLPRLTLLIEASKEVNGIIWGEGLPTYPRVYRNENWSTYYVAKNGNAYEYSAEETAFPLTYKLISDEVYGTVIAYRYSLKLGEGEYVDVRKGDALTSAHLSRCYYVQRTLSAEGDAIFTLGEYRYIDLPDYKEKEPEHYYDENADDPNYDYVRFDSEYTAVEDIKGAAEQVYAKRYLDSVYQSLFDGIAVEESGGLLRARYVVQTDSRGAARLMKSNQIKAINTDRVFLMETARMSTEKKSNAKTVYVDIDTHLAGSDKIETVRVCLVLQDGAWYLNSPTY